MLGTLADKNTFVNRAISKLLMLHNAEMFTTVLRMRTGDTTSR